MKSHIRHGERRLNQNLSSSLFVLLIKSLVREFTKVQVNSFLFAISHTHLDLINIS
jgi:hypothetical protein